MIVYVVMVYNYSDTACGGAYRERDVADAVARKESGTVEEYDIDALIDDEQRVFMRPGQRMYSVRMRWDGQNAKADVQWTDPDPKRRLMASSHFHELIGECWATDEVHAVKIVNDRRTQWLANGGYDSLGAVVDPRFDHWRHWL